MTRKPLGWIRSGKSIVLLGLDYAGKTTLVNQWTKGVAEKATTTIGMDIEHVDFGGETFNLIDLGGQEAFRKTLWKTYAKMANGVIFIFDITDRKRTPEAVDWFWTIESWLQEDVPIMFCANKIDLKDDPTVENPMSLEEIIETFKLKQFARPFSNQHSFWIYELSAKTAENVNEAMDWLFSKVQQKQFQSDLRGITVLSVEDGSIFLQVPLNESYDPKKELQKLQKILKMNKELSVQLESSMQFYDQENASDCVFMQDKYICSVSAVKGSAPHSVRIIGESILAVLLSQHEEGGEMLPREVLEDVIRHNFGSRSVPKDLHSREKQAI
ncbi:MAG: GTP-binding protein [Candidatus Heimdallarchaeota archaeon]|nr:GTP-binding protein [Candidatus Heimdallarchaeota archaeon]